MGIILANDFVNVGNSEITARSETAGFAKVNVMDLWHMKRRFRADDLTKSDINPLMVFDLSTATTLVGIMLNDINFDKVRIRGHATDLGVDWSASTFDSGADHAVSEDEVVNRYKIYIPLTAFNLRWLAIMTPAAASAVGTYTTKWEIGTAPLIKSAITLTKNMAYGYERTSRKQYYDIELPHGGIERVALGNDLRWTGTVVFNHRKKTDEPELWDVNSLNFNDPIIFYENDSEDEKCYLAVRDAAYSGTIKYSSLVYGNTIRFIELI